MRDRASRREERRQGGIQIETSDEGEKVGRSMLGGGLVPGLIEELGGADGLVKLEVNQRHLLCNILFVEIPYIGWCQRNKIKYKKQNKRRKRLKRYRSRGGRRALLGEVEGPTALLRTPFVKCC